MPGKLVIHDSSPLKPVPLDFIPVVPGSNCVSVRDYGAVGDGNVDDSIAFLKAIKASLTVYIPKGTYYIGRTLELSRALRLFGDGQGISIIRGDNVGYGQASATVGSHRLFFTRHSFAAKDISFIRTDSPRSDTSEDLLRLEYTDDRLYKQDVHVSFNRCDIQGFFCGMFVAGNFQDDARSVFNIKSLSVRNCRIRTNLESGNYMASTIFASCIDIVDIENNYLETTDLDQGSGWPGCECNNIYMYSCTNTSIRNNIVVKGMNKLDTFGLTCRGDLWGSGIVYRLNDKIYVDKIPYHSLQNNNKGHKPGEIGSELWWKADPAFIGRTYFYPVKNLVVDGNVFVNSATQAWRCACFGSPFERITFSNNIVLHNWSQVNSSFGLNSEARPDSVDPAVLPYAFNQVIIRDNLFLDVTHRCVLFAAGAARIKSVVLSNNRYHGWGTRDRDPKDTQHIPAVDAGSNTVGDTLICSNDVADGSRYVKMEWSPTGVYDSNDWVAFLGSKYRSLVSDNCGNVPGANSAAWELNGQNVGGMYRGFAVGSFKNIVIQNVIQENCNNGPDGLL